MRNPDGLWLKQSQGVTIGDYVLDRYIVAGKIGYVYEAHMSNIPEVRHAVKITPRVRSGWVKILK